MEDIEKICQTMWKDYQHSISSAGATTWDWVFVTASNESQAMAYRIQIEERLKNNRLPKKTKYAVVADPVGKRIGSGGATLNVLKYISEHSCDKHRDIFDAKILVIHSGGDSKRIPQYSACGKLFSPVPRLLPNGRRSLLFDEIMISLSSLPGRIDHGILAVSGDVLLLFNPMQIDLRSNKAAVAVSAKESAGVGASHGVFLSNDQNRVTEFLHKQPAETLGNIGAVDKNGQIDLDTGIVWLDKKIVSDLFSLVSTDNAVDPEKFDLIANDGARLNFYGDFLYPLAESAEYDRYMASAGENPPSGKLLECRRAIWPVLSKHGMSLIRLSPAKFIHFGTTRELHRLVGDGLGEYKFLGWSRNVLTNIPSEKYSASNSYIDSKATIGRGCHIEDCHIGENVRVGDNAMLSNLKIENMDIPGDVAMHGIELNNSKYCARIYGIDDNPKDVADGAFDLWTADIYPVCETAREAIESALIVYRLSKGIATDEEFHKWKMSDKTSLGGSARNADVAKIFKWRSHLENAVRLCQR
jgi:fucokinase